MCTTWRCVGISVPPFALGLASLTTTFPPAFQKYVILPNLEHARVLKNEENFPWTAYVGVLGMPGLTAYCAWKEYAQAKKGETAFVTTAAGMQISSCLWSTYSATSLGI